MNDLVNCLRKWSRREAIAPGSLAEAADEIESLQARLAEVEAERDIRLAQVETHVQANVRLEARLAEAEALLDDARTALNSESRLYWRIDAFLAADSASGCDHKWVNASNFEPGPNERCVKCDALRQIEGAR